MNKRLLLILLCIQKTDPVRGPLCNSSVTAAKLAARASAGRVV
jgi:hypothetical protein